MVAPHIKRRRLAATAAARKRADGEARRREEVLSAPVAEKAKVVTPAVVKSVFKPELSKLKKVELIALAEAKGKFCTKKNNAFI